MQVPYDEGVASHIGPESCGGDREVAAEALTGESAGQVLSRVYSVRAFETQSRVFLMDTPGLM
jgi:hypothetical protein